MEAGRLPDEFQPYTNELLALLVLKPDGTDRPVGCPEAGRRVGGRSSMTASWAQSLIPTTRGNSENALLIESSSDPWLSIGVTSVHYRRIAQRVSVQVCS